MYTLFTPEQFSVYLLKTSIKYNTIITLTKFNIDTIILTTNEPLGFFSI